MTMQYRIQLAGVPADLGAIEHAIVDRDPSALLDLDATGRLLRVSTLLDDDELLAAVNRAGVPATALQLERVPSECCGGCGG